MKATLSFASMPEGEELIDLNSLEDLVQIIERYQEKVIVSLAHRKGATLSIVIYNEEVEHVGEIAEMTDEQLTQMYLSADTDNPTKQAQAIFIEHASRRLEVKNRKRETELP